MGQHSKRGGKGRRQAQPQPQPQGGNAKEHAKEDAKEGAQNANPLSLSKAALQRSRKTPGRPGYRYTLQELLTLRKPGSDRYPAWTTIPNEIKMRGGVPYTTPQADGGRAGLGGWQPIGTSPNANPAPRRAVPVETALPPAEEDAGDDEPAVVPPSLIPDGEAEPVRTTSPDVDLPMPSLEPQPQQAEDNDQAAASIESIEADMELLLNNSNHNAAGEAQTASDAAMETVLQQAGVMATPVKSPPPQATPLSEEDVADSSVMAAILSEVTNAGAMPELEEMRAMPAVQAATPVRKAMLDMGSATRAPASPWAEEAARTPARATPGQEEMGTPAAGAATGGFLFNRTPLSASLSAGGNMAHIHTPSAKEKAIWAAPPASAPPKVSFTARAAADPEEPPQLLPPGYEPPKDPRASAFTPPAAAKSIGASPAKAATPANAASPAPRPSPASSLGYKASYTPSPSTSTNAYAQAAANVAAQGDAGAFGLDANQEAQMRQLETQQAMLRMQALRNQQEKLLQNQADLVRQIHFQQQAAATEMSMMHRMGAPSMGHMPPMGATPWLP
eukprot:TRINITY_DN439_c0_g3_i1.p1 TRINITY_DN439_c0_g3~~TRINITY_DN439_c0_g3_i1.p1  ORF type:complete len:561 (+),score=186.52 TRINITY_DN439_c0_g3_i1:115-1797(+)